MRAALRFVSLGILVVGVVFWLFGGPNLGWTKTTVPVDKLDPVTEIEYREWERRFVPGLDFVGACVVLAMAVFATSWLARARPTLTSGAINEE